MSLKQKIKYGLPVPLKKALKYAYHCLLDAKDWLTGRRDAQLPPRRLNFVGSEGFLAVSREFFGYFTRPDIGKVQPGERILDIGSGVGRMAIPFADYLKPEGGYWGFDIDRRGVAWCHRHLSKKHPNFHFRFVDLYNKYYNKKGKLQPSAFRFPYEDGFFDFAFATSVFTHMFTGDVRHYLDEIHRVLRPGGRALVTFFAIDALARKNIDSGKAACLLVHPRDSVAYYSHKNVPEAEIGFDADWIESAVHESGLRIEKILHGSWSGRPQPLSYQDLYLIEKP